MGINVSKEQATLVAVLNQIGEELLGIDCPTDQVKYDVALRHTYQQLRDALAEAYRAGASIREDWEAAAAPSRTSSKGIEAGATVTFPYNGVEYTALVLHLNQKTAKVRILKMDGPPTRKGVVVGAELRCGLSLLKRGV